MELWRLKSFVTKIIKLSQTDSCHKIILKIPLMAQQIEHHELIKVSQLISPYISRMTVILCWNTITTPTPPSHHPIIQMYPHIFQSSVKVTLRLAFVTTNYSYHQRANPRWRRPTFDSTTIATQTNVHAVRTLICTVCRSFVELLASSRLASSMLLNIQFTPRPSAFPSTTPAQCTSLMFAPKI